jgi:hypothetical protein
VTKRKTLTPEQLDSVLRLLPKMGIRAIAKRIDVSAIAVRRAMIRWQWSQKAKHNSVNPLKAGSSQSTNP